MNLLFPERFDAFESELAVMEEDWSLDRCVPAFHTEYAVPKVDRHIFKQKLLLIWK